MVQKCTLRNLFKVYEIFSMYIEKQKCENLLQLAFLVFLPFRPFSCLFDHVTFPDELLQRCEYWVPMKADGFKFWYTTTLVTHANKIFQKEVLSEIYLTHAIPPVPVLIRIIYMYVVLAVSQASALPFLNLILRIGSKNWLPNWIPLRCKTHEIMKSQIYFRNWRQFLKRL